MEEIALDQLYGCGSCQILKQDLDKSRQFYANSFEKLKEKIVCTDKLIRLYKQKKEECDTQIKKLAEGSSLIESLQRDCVRYQHDLAEVLKQLEPLRQQLQLHDGLQCSIKELKSQLATARDQIAANEVVQHQYMSKWEETKLLKESMQLEIRKFKKSEKELNKKIGSVESEWQSKLGNQKRRHDKLLEHFLKFGKFLDGNGLLKGKNRVIFKSYAAQREKNGSESENGEDESEQGSDEDDRNADRLEQLLSSPSTDLYFEQKVAQGSRDFATSPLPLSGFVRQTAPPSRDFATSPPPFPGLVRQVVRPSRDFATSPPPFPWFERQVAPLSRTVATSTPPFPGLRLATAPLVRNVSCGPDMDYVDQGKILNQLVDFFYRRIDAVAPLPLTPLERKNQDKVLSAASEEIAGVRRDDVLDDGDISASSESDVNASSPLNIYDSDHSYSLASASPPVWNRAPKQSGSDDSPLIPRGDVLVDVENPNRCQPTVSTFGCVAGVKRIPAKAPSSSADKLHSLVPCHLDPTGGSKFAIVNGDQASADHLAETPPAVNDTVAVAGADDLASAREDCQPVLRENENSLSRADGVVGNHTKPVPQLTSLPSDNGVTNLLGFNEEVGRLTPLPQIEAGSVFSENGGDDSGRSFCPSTVLSKDSIVAPEAPGDNRVTPILEVSDGTEAVPNHESLSTLSLLPLSDRSTSSDRTTEFGGQIIPAVECQFSTARSLLSLPAVSSVDKLQSLVPSHLNSTGGSKFAIVNGDQASADHLAETPSAVNDTITVAGAEDLASTREDRQPALRENENSLPPADVEVGNHTKSVPQLSSLPSDNGLTNLLGFNEVVGPLTPLPQIEEDSVFSENGGDESGRLFCPSTVLPKDSIVAPEAPGDNCITPVSEVSDGTETVPNNEGLSRYSLTTLSLQPLRNRSTSSDRTPEFGGQIIPAVEYQFSPARSPLSLPDVSSADKIHTLVQSHLDQTEGSNSAIVNGNQASADHFAETPPVVNDTVAVAGVEALTFAHGDRLPALREDENSLWRSDGVVGNHPLPVPQLSGQHPNNGVTDLLGFNEEVGPLTPLPQIEEDTVLSEHGGDDSGRSFCPSIVLPKDSIVAPEAPGDDHVTPVSVVSDGTEAVPNHKILSRHSLTMLPSSDRSTSSDRTTEFGDQLIPAVECQFSTASLHLSLPAVSSADKIHSLMPSHLDPTEGSKSAIVNENQASADHFADTPPAVNDTAAVAGAEDLTSPLEDRQPALREDENFLPCVDGVVGNQSQPDPQLFALPSGNGDLLGFNEEVEPLTSVPQIEEDSVLSENSGDDSGQSFCSSIVLPKDSIVAPETPSDDRVTPVSEVSDGTEAVPNHESLSRHSLTMMSLQPLSDQSTSGDRTSEFRGETLPATECQFSTARSLLSSPAVHAAFEDIIGDVKNAGKDIDSGTDDAKSCFLSSFDLVPNARIEMEEFSLVPSDKCLSVCGDISCIGERVTVDAPRQDSVGPKCKRRRKFFSGRYMHAAAARSTVDTPAVPSTPSKVASSSSEDDISLAQLIRKIGVKKLIDDNSGLLQTNPRIEDLVEAVTLPPKELRSAMVEDMAQDVTLVVMDVEASTTTNAGMVQPENLQPPQPKENCYLNLTGYCKPFSDRRVPSSGDTNKVVASQAVTVSSCSDATLHLPVIVSSMAQSIVGRPAACLSPSRTSTDVGTARTVGKASSQRDLRPRVTFFFKRPSTKLTRSFTFIKKGKLRGASDRLPSRCSLAENRRILTAVLSDGGCSFRSSVVVAPVPVSSLASTGFRSDAPAVASRVSELILPEPLPVVAIVPPPSETEFFDDCERNLTALSSSFGNRRPVEQLSTSDDVASAETTARVRKKGLRIRKRKIQQHDAVKMSLEHLEKEMAVLLSIFEETIVDARYSLPISPLKADNNSLASSSASPEIVSDATGAQDFAEPKFKRRRKSASITCLQAAAARKLPVDITIVPALPLSSKVVTSSSDDDISLAQILRKTRVDKPNNANANAGTSKRPMEAAVDDARVIKRKRSDGDEAEVSVEASGLRIQKNSALAAPPSCSSSSGASCTTTPTFTVPGPLSTTNMMDIGRVDNITATVPFPRPQGNIFVADELRDRPVMTSCPFIENISAQLMSIPTSGHQPLWNSLAAGLLSVLKPELIPMLCKQLVDWIDRPPQSAIATVVRRPKQVEAEAEAKCLRLLDLLRSHAVAATLEDEMSRLLVESVTAGRKEVSRKSTLCRFYVALCRDRQWSGRARIFLFDVIKCCHPWWGQLLSAILVAWPELLSGSTVDDPLFAVLGYALVVKEKVVKFDSRIDRFKVLSTLGCLGTHLSLDKLTAMLVDRLKSGSEWAVFEARKSLELLGRLEPWPWISSNIVNRHLWPMMKRTEQLPDLCIANSFLLFASLIKRRSIEQPTTGVMAINFMIASLTPDPAVGHSHAACIVNALVQSILMLLNPANHAAKHALLQWLSTGRHRLTVDTIKLLELCHVR